MTDLLACPFCGGEPEIIRMGSGRQSMIYACTDCGCRLETSETFIGPHCSWNTRLSALEPSNTPITGQPPEQESPGQPPIVAGAP